MHLLEMINYKKIGTVLVLIIIAGGAVFVLHKKQTQVSPFADVARHAIATSIVAENNLDYNNKFISVTGPLTSPDMLGDGEYLKPLSYAVEYRKAEMYSWVEIKGEEKGTTTYAYEKQWVELPTSAVFFNNYQDHYNPPRKAIRSSMFISTTTSINGYHLDLARTRLPRLLPISLTKDMLMPRNDISLIDTTFFFKSLEGKSTYENPEIGDMRVSYLGLPVGATSTAFGQAEAATLVPYVFGNQTIYSLTPGTREDALKVLETQ